MPGWEPRFPVPAADDLEVGTVWLTRDDGGRTTTWVVLDSDPGARVRYARVAEAWTAGTVTVGLADASDGCRVTVEYDLTAVVRMPLPSSHASPTTTRRTSAPGVGRSSTTSPRADACRIRSEPVDGCRRSEADSEVT